jgi:hypothetical protein
MIAGGLAFDDVIWWKQLMMMTKELATSGISGQFSFQVQVGCN